MIFELVKKSFKELCNKPLIPLFYILFLIVMCLVSPYVFILQPVYSLVVAICLFFMFTLFLGGWLELFKERNSKEEKSNAGIFLEGAGKHIIPNVILIMLYFLFMTLIFYIGSFIATKIFGDLSFISREMSSAAQNSNAFIEYLSNLPPDKQYILYGWQFTFVILCSVFNFLFMFIPAILVETECKNVFIKPFIVLKDNLRFTFKNFGFSICTYLIICLGFILIGIINALTAFLHPIFGIIYTLIQIYFISYVIMLIFNCYEHKNSDTDRCDSVGENKDSNSDSEEQ